MMPICWITNTAGTGSPTVATTAPAYAYWYVDQTTATTTMWVTNTGTSLTTATNPTWQVQRHAVYREIDEFDEMQRRMDHESRARRMQGDQLRRFNDAAKKRARELLIEHLTPAQKRTFAKNDWFVVEGGKSKTRYRISAKNSLVANIDVMTVDGKITHRLCGHCDPGKLPLHDHLLAQKMMLEHAEDEFLKLANRHVA
jgi:hypothetical protein